MTFIALLARAVTKLRTATADEVGEVLKTVGRLAHESFVGLHQRAVVVQLVQLVLERVKISAEGEISLHKDAVVDSSD